jgi:hypothetical protein
MALARTVSRHYREIKYDKLMSAISSISSWSVNPYQTAGPNNVSQSIKDFRALGSALQSGSLATAQSALASFQQDLQASSQTSASQPFGNNTQANTDYQSLTSALQTGNLSAAQQAFASLQSDLLTAAQGHHHHHHHAVTGASSTQTVNTGAGTLYGSGSNSLNVTA